MWCLGRGTWAIRTASPASPRSTLQHHWALCGFSATSSCVSTTHASIGRELKSASLPPLDCMWAVFKRPRRHAPLTHPEFYKMPRSLAHQCIALWCQCLAAQRHTPKWTLGKHSRRSHVSSARSATRCCRRSLLAFKWERHGESISSNI